MSVYKKFTTQDYSVVPFNAHKQYDFDSASADNNGITYFDTVWSNGAIDTYTSGNIKYSQLDHLYYRDFKRDVNNKLGDSHYLNQKRPLYQNANILSIPAGLYGHQIKPGTFLLSSSNITIIDDSKGNLLVSGTDISEYLHDIRSNVLNIGPVKGFKKYDLNNIQGVETPNKISGYTTPGFGDEFDDSYYYNLLQYDNVTFSEQSLYLDNHEFPTINFNTSSITINNSENFNTDITEGYAISFWINPTTADDCYIITKTKGDDNLLESKFPFHISIKDIGNTPIIRFNVSDGVFNKQSAAGLTLGVNQHVVCRVSASNMSITVNDIKTSDVLLPTGFINNSANIHIGSDGIGGNHFSGSLSQINIYQGNISDTQISNHRKSSNNSPYIGNIFYSTGIATITHPGYQSSLNNLGVGYTDVNGNFIVGPLPTTDITSGISSIKFQGSHLIYENEYQCTIDEHEYNSTTNISARKTRIKTNQDLADFTTGSLFKPYVTTIGLYSEENELLVIGKLGQPVRTSNETDTTFVLRWDT